VSLATTPCGHRESQMAQTRMVASAFAFNSDAKHRPRKAATARISMFGRAVRGAEAGARGDAGMTRSKSVRT
jgi:hypothetical protein